MDKLFKNIEDLFKKKDKDSIGIVLDEEKMHIKDIIQSKGYPFEEYGVETEDGYLLTIFRIQGAKFECEKTYLKRVRRPVLFQHGLLDSSDGWLCNTEERCLPFIMANLGYDVYLSNSRGNKHSKKHKKHGNSTFEFWQFSFHEMGLYDLPAILDFISTNNKSKEKIIYIGHSQGTAMMFAALTEKIEYFKEKIKLIIALAPVARVGGLSSTFLKLLEGINFHKMLKSSKQYEVFPSSESSSSFNSWINKNFTSLSHLFVDMVSDGNSAEVNTKERLGIYLTHYPAGGSLKSVQHFIQNFNCKKFSYYDYKEEANMLIYKQKVPPEYDLSKIKGIPIVMMAGTDDKLATLNDVRWLKEQLQNDVIFYKEYEKMGHITFLMGKNVDWFEDALDIILKHRDNPLNEMD